mmetsp:Transcript_36468/g.43954  ORF Transcript_36468/g.43954 Transcript_36468/m.43954 type:complete len:884 (+) Transcript_36468:79-2730(+)
MMWTDEEEAVLNKRDSIELSKGATERKIKPRKGKKDRNKTMVDEGSAQRDEESKSLTCPSNDEFSYDPETMAREVGTEEVNKTSEESSTSVRDLQRDLSPQERTSKKFLPLIKSLRLSFAHCWMRVLLSFQNGCHISKSKKVLLLSSFCTTLVICISLKLRWTGNNDGSYREDSITSDVHIPYPPSNINEICTTPHVTLYSGRKECERACKPWVNLDRSTSCMKMDNNICEKYASCEILTATHSVTTYYGSSYNQYQYGHVPPASVELEVACSVSSNGDIMNSDQCNNLCQPGICCLLEGSANCYAKNEINCDGFSPCVAASDLFIDYSGNLQLSPSNLNQVCSKSNVDNYEGHTACLNMCQAALCCIGLGSDCASISTEECKTYSICKNVWSTTSAGSESSVDDFAVELVGKVPLPIDALCSVEVMGVKSRLEHCDKACSSASCCWETGLGNCFDSNELACLDYKSCPGFGKNGGVVDVPVPEENLTDLCSESNILSALKASDECRNVCALGSCCFDEGSKNCQTQFEEECDLYQPCLNLPSDSLNAVVPSPLSVICSEQNIVTYEGRRSCEISCAPGYCCFSGDEDRCSASNEKNCRAYEACAVLIVLDAAPLELEVVCSEKSLATVSGSVECVEMCIPSSCCFDETSSCRLLNESQCKSWIACKNTPNSQNVYEDSPLAQTCSSSQIGTTNGLLNCKSECKQSACCYLEGSDSCYTESEELCLEYEYYCKSVLLGDVTSLPSDAYNPIDEELSTVARMCTQVNFETEEGRIGCEDECKKADCCEKTQENSCYTENTKLCDEYIRACGAVPKLHSTFNIPKPHADLLVLCSKSSTSSFEGLTLCKQGCEASTCCREPHKENCRDVNKDVCDAYKPCEILFN